jgi:hypothetical protein
MLEYHDFYSLGLLKKIAHAWAAFGIFNLHSSKFDNP